MEIKPNLPVELWHEIFSYLDYKDLKLLLSVNKYFNYLIAPATSTATKNFLDRQLFRDFPRPASFWKAARDKVYTSWNVYEWSKDPYTYNPDFWKINAHPAIQDDKYGNFIIEKNIFHRRGEAIISCYNREFQYPIYTESTTINLLLTFGNGCGYTNPDKHITKKFWLENATSPAVTALEVISYARMGGRGFSEAVEITSKHGAVTVFDFMMARILGLYRIYTLKKDRISNMGNGGKWMLVDAVKRYMLVKGKKGFTQMQIEMLEDWIDKHDIEEKLGLAKLVKNADNGKEGKGVDLEHIEDVNKRKRGIGKGLAKLLGLTSRMERRPSE